MSNVIRVIKRQELTKIGNRHVSACGRHHYLAEEHLDWHLAQAMSKKWCSVGCMARTMFQRNTLANRTAVRQRIAPLFKALLKRDKFLVIEYDQSDHGKINACKILEGTDQLEKQYAMSQLERMRKRGQMNEETFQHANEVVGAQKA